MSRGFSAEWQAILARHRARVPRGSGFAAYTQAARDAAREYHGGRSENPARPSWETPALIGGALVVAWWLVSSGKLKAIGGGFSTTAVQQQMSGGTGL